MKEFIEIPFGAKDSELGGWEYNIPEGMEATIVDNKIVVKKKDSEDESIRKMCMKYLDREYQHCSFVDDRKMIEKCIAYLEKQGEQKPETIFLKFRIGDKVTNGEYTYTINYIGKDCYWVKEHDCATIPFKYQHLWKLVEQKPADKVEPKFNVGDWIIHNKNIELSNSLMLVTGKDNNEYLCKDIDGQCSYNIEFIDKDYHLWTIQDAKDGDVLAFDNNTIVMFKDLYNSTTFHSYCHIENGIFDSNKDELPDWWEGEGFKPATKEQRDLLFTKIKEAGYEWDVEKKELKKIEQTTMLETCEIENIEHGKYYYCIKDYFCGGRKQASKGDVVQALRGMSMMALGVKANEYFLPVNSIEQKPAWSEEDELMLESVIDKISDLGTGEMIKDWLKSLKERYTWKPSDEQMEVLVWCKPLFADPKSKGILESLINDLKKLREE